MRVLRLGDRGDDVLAWELFLRGQNFYWVEADGDFDEATEAATRDWQQDQLLRNDGVVGPKTYGKAQLLGFNPGFSDSDTSENSPAWPPPPDFPALSSTARRELFGIFAFRPAGLPNNPEAIVITDGWDKTNIVRAEIPQLVGIQGFAGRHASLHVKCADQIKAFFQAVQDEGLLGHVLTWGGSWAPRFVRGSRTYLSNHAYGTAFDINVPWNGLGVTPALKGRRGSVRELVPIAYRFGLYWGGHFTRQDGMHFEVAKIL